MATAFPFDPSGTSSANRITNEQHVITAQNFRDYHYVIPNFAPFFERDFTIKLQYPNGNVRNLTLGVDYYFSNQFLDASRACAKPVYGSISFLDTDTAGILSISYNTVGGMWNITPQEITRILAEEMRNPRITSWEQITYLPERFPVIDHEWDLVDMVGGTEVVAAIENVAAAVLAANGGGLNEHVNNYSNPHNVTKSQVGLGNVLNYAIATIAEAQAGTSNGQYMTPLRTKDAINNLGGALVSAHADRTDNPHGVTKSQVGLGSVDNYATASQTEAEAGSSTIKFMTPLRTAQAIAAQVGTAFNTHAANRMNPHNVTKDQVGLFNVQNYAIATAEEARAGTASDKYMTPQRTTQLVMEFVTVAMDGHATRTDNPHDTTKAHVGLGNVDNYATATQAQAAAGTSNTTFMTPGRTADAINARATPASHLLAFDNPHQVTKDQVNLGFVQNYGIATRAEAIAANINTAYMTPSLTRDTVEALATPIAHASNTANPHQVTSVQVGAYSIAQTDALLAGYVPLDARWVAGQAESSFITKVLGGTAANADMLNGQTLNQILDQVANVGYINSHDIAKVIDPVATPYRWILLGEVTALLGVKTDSVDAIGTTYPDVYWFMSGGHKQEATGALNAAATSPAYIIHAKNGLATNNHAFEVIRMNGSANSDVLFGYTFDSATNVMQVWLRVSVGFNDVNLTKMASMANTIVLNDDTVVIEPTGITYVTPFSYATSMEMATLASRITDLEDTINSIAVV